MTESKKIILTYKISIPRAIVFRVFLKIKFEPVIIIFQRAVQNKHKYFFERIETRWRQNMSIASSLILASLIAVDAARSINYLRSASCSVVRRPTALVSRTITRFTSIISTGPEAFRRRRKMTAPRVEKRGVWLAFPGDRRTTDFFQLAHATLLRS